MSHDNEPNFSRKRMFWNNSLEKSNEPFSSPLGPRDVYVTLPAPDRYNIDCGGLSILSSFCDEDI